MAKEEKTGYKRKRKNRNEVDKFVSDDSDEDYKIDEDEVLDESEEDYGSSLAEEESQESLGAFEEEEEEEEVERIADKFESVRMPRRRNNIRSTDTTVSMKSTEKKMDADYVCVSEGAKSKAAEEELHAGTLGWLRKERDELTDRKPTKKPRVKKTRNGPPFIPYGGEEDVTKYLEEDEDYDDDADDEDFIPTEDMETAIDEPKKKQGPRKNKSTSGKKLSNRKRTVQTKTNKNTTCGTRDSDMSSDSDFELQGSSEDDDDDNDYTISDEESEFIREASEICGRPTSGLRDPSLLEAIEEEDSPLKRKDHGRKGKQKVDDIKVQAGKQVCGICLSEEGRRKAVGVLSCCTHYFCFTCILEWSKVESRCPLCKQRFATIRRTMRPDGIHDERDTIFPVPERDQVYQPSEEELRGYLDPYENVLCTECNQGGDDALMLLCDLCDSSTHTYCVDLGSEVPDGNWYCDGCRPTAMAPENGASSHIYSNPIGSQPANPVRESFDLNEVYVPDAPPSPSPRISTPQTGAASSPSRSTLFHRRRWHRQILEIRNFVSQQREINYSTGIVPGTGVNPRGSSVTSLSAAQYRDAFSSFRAQSSSTSSSHGVAASGFNGGIDWLYF